VVSQKGLPPTPDWAVHVISPCTWRRLIERR
jgi:hypothetical protein